MKVPSEKLSWKVIVKATVYFKIAAEQGHAGAQFVYGRLLMEKGTKKCF
jgi:TPR repeat protein